MSALAPTAASKMRKCQHLVEYRVFVQMPVLVKDESGQLVPDGDKTERRVLCLGCGQTCKPDGARIKWADNKELEKALCGVDDEKDMADQEKLPQAYITHVFNVRRLCRHDWRPAWEPVHN